MPLVSILVPTYNHEKYISECLESLLNQKTTFEYEILVGEDDSEDRTRQICKEFAEKYPDKIKLFLNDRKNVIYINGRPTGRWNLMNLIKHARGKYICLCEGDDMFVDPEKLQHQVDFMEEHTDYSMSFHPAVWWKPAKNLVRIYHPVEKKNYYTLEDFLTAQLLIATSSVMYRTDAIRPLPDWFKLPPTGDIALNALAASKGKIGYIDRVMSLYRFHGKGMASKHSESQKAEYTIQGFNIIAEHLGVKDKKSFRTGMHVLNRWLENARKFEEQFKPKSEEDFSDTLEIPARDFLKKALEYGQQAQWDKAVYMAGTYRDQRSKEIFSYIQNEIQTEPELSIVYYLPQKSDFRNFLTIFDNQSYPIDKFEVIAVTPGTIDDHMLSEASFKIKFVSIPDFYPVQEAFNAGAMFADGRILLFLHAIDSIFSEYLEKVDLYFRDLSPRMVVGRIRISGSGEESNGNQLSGDIIHNNVAVLKTDFLKFRGLDPLLSFFAFSELKYWIEQEYSTFAVLQADDLVTFVLKENMLKWQKELEQQKKFIGEYIRKKEITFANWFYEHYSRIVSEDAVSIVIVTYNSSGTLQNNLNSVLNTIRPGDEIIVIDNNSTDNTKEILKLYEQQFKNIKVIYNPENVGFTRASNQGIRISKNPYVILLNPDTVVTRHWIEKLLTKAEPSDIGAVGPVSNYAAGLQNVGNYFRFDQKISVDELTVQLERKYRGRVVETKLLIGFCMLLKKSVLERIGLMDEQLFLGNDDLELSWRMRLHGYRLLVAPDTFIFHDGHHSFKQDKTSKSEMLVQESTNVLYRKLQKYYGPDHVPLPEKIWGMSWFRPDNARFNPDVDWKAVKKLPGNPEDEEPYEVFETESGEKNVDSRRILSSDKLVSIVMLTYNQLEYTRKCVDSLYKFTTMPFELIIVDNYSTDGTRKWLKKLEKEKKNVRLILNMQNKGFPGGCNQGIRIAKGDYILLLNNDVIVTPHWLERMVAAFEKDPQLGIVGPMTNNISGPQKDPNAKYSTLEEMFDYAEKVSRERAGELLYFPRIVGFAMLIRKEVIEKIGYLEESFGTGNYEDDDFCLRAELAGFKAAIVKDSFIHHFGSVSFTAEGSQKYVEKLQANSDKFYQKWKDLEQPSLLWSIFLFNKAKEEREKGNTDFALELYEKVFRMKPEEKVLIEEYTQLLLEMGQPEVAVEKLEMYLEKQPADHEAWNFFGMLLLDKGDVAKAHHAFKKAVSLHQSNLDYIRNLADTSILVADFESATSALQYILTVKPGDKEATLKLASLMVEAGQIEKAREFISYALEKDPTDEKLQFYLKKTSEPELFLAYAFIESGQYDLAEEVLEKILKQDPMHIEALQLKASILFYRQDYKSAEEVYNQILKQEPSNNEGLYYLMKIKLSNESKEEFIRFTEENRHVIEANPALYREWINGLLELEEYEKALYHIDQYIHKFPDDYFGYWIMGTLYRENGEEDKAVRFFHKAVEKGIPDTDVLESIQKFVSELEMAKG